jgi:hypothetical protein
MIDMPSSRSPLELPGVRAERVDFGGDGTDLERDVEWLPERDQDDQQGHREWPQLRDVASPPAASLRTPAANAARSCQASTAPIAVPAVIEHDVAD